MTEVVLGALICTIQSVPLTCSILAERWHSVWIGQLLSGNSLSRSAISFPERDKSSSQRFSLWVSATIKLLPFGCSSLCTGLGRRVLLHLKARGFQNEALCRDEAYLCGCTDGLQTSSLFVTLPPPPHMSCNPKECHCNCFFMEINIVVAL